MPGVAERVNAFVENAPITRVPPDASLLRTLFMVPRWILQARARRRGMKSAVRADKLFRVLAHNEPAYARDLLAELEDLAASEVDMHAGAALLRSWRSLHRFLAILMIVSVSVHIAVAWYYGFRWIF
jgi:hypothetical protein